MGAIAGRVADRELLIESLFIEKDSRGKGGGRLLFEALTEACGAFCSGIRVCFSAVNKDMETLPGFFEAMGFRERDGGFDRMFLADLRELERSPLAVRKGRRTPFSQVSPKVLRQLSAEAAENGWVVPRNGFFCRFRGQGAVDGTDRP